MRTGGCAKTPAHKAACRMHRKAPWRRGPGVVLKCMDDDQIYRGPFHVFRSAIGNQNNCGVAKPSDLAAGADWSHRRRGQPRRPVAWPRTAAEAAILAVKEQPLRGALHQLLAMRLSSADQPVSAYIFTVFESAPPLKVAAKSVFCTFAACITIVGRSCINPLSMS